MNRKHAESDDPMKNKERSAEDETVEVEINTKRTEAGAADDEETEIEIKTTPSEDDEAPEDTGAPEEKPEEPPESESERYLRLAAEFDNYKKRTAREYGDLITSANSRLLRSLIDILDNFERALDGDSATADMAAYRQGVELIYNQFTDLLQRERVTAIEAVGQAFDPNIHEAMLQQESNEHDEGIVCTEIQKGYKIGDKVLRHARVIVSSGPKRTDNENNESE